MPAGCSCVRALLSIVCLMRASLRPSASISALAPHSRKIGAVVRDFKNHVNPMAED
jgi:hypothetical protein